MASGDIYDLIDFREHAALIAVAEAADKAMALPHDCIDDHNQDERPSNVRWCPYCIALDALANLAAIRKV